MQLTVDQQPVAAASVPDPFPQWDYYPTHVEQHDPFLVQAEQLRDRTLTLSKSLFSPSKTNVRLIDIDTHADGSQSCYTKVCQSSDGLQQALLTPAIPRVRIISIHSPATVLPLSVTEEVIRKILTKYNVNPEFFHVLFSLGGAPHISEGGSSNAMHSTSPDGSQITCCYQLQYTEENQRSKHTPWSFRHTAVYHHHDSASNFDLFILLHSIEDSYLEQQLISLTKPGPRSQSMLRTLLADPSNLHLLIASSYVNNWRWYLRYVGQSFEDKNEDAFTLDPSTAGAALLSFEAVRTLREIHDEVLRASSLCRGNIAVIRTIKCLRENDVRYESFVESSFEKLRGYMTSFETLQKRINNTMELLAYTLDLKNQSTAAEINQSLLSLTHNTTDDSATVRIITILSLVYLPGSFIATLYGTNFFVFNEESKRFLITSDFWIFVCTWVPLTALTIGVYCFIRWRKKKALKEVRQRVRSFKGSEKV